MLVLSYWHIGKKQSTQSRVGEAKNPKTVVRSQQNEPKTYVFIFCIFFLKQQGQS
jgi:hypothetical protein